MRAGALRQRIGLYTADPEGQGEELGTVWADLTDARHTRAWGASVVDPESALSFVVRWFADHARVGYVRHWQENYQVESIADPDGRRRELEILCRRLVP